MAGTTHEPYGHGWSINASYPELKMARSIPDFPEDTYWAEGHEGQFIFVIPAWDLVMVRLGCDRKGQRFDPVKFGKLVSEARMKKSVHAAGATR